MALMRSYIYLAGRFATLVLAGMLPVAPLWADDAKSATNTVNKLQQEVDELKYQLAIALLRPELISLDAQELEAQLSPAKRRAVGTKRQEISNAQGQLAQSDVTRVLRSRKKAVQACYQRLIRRDSSFHHRQLKVQIGFSVQPSGRPSNVSVTPNHNGSLSKCIKSAITRSVFPAFRGPAAEIRVPFVLMPTN